MGRGVGALLLVAVSSAAAMAHGGAAGRAVQVTAGAAVFALTTCVVVAINIAECRRRTVSAAKEVKLHATGGELGRLATIGAIAYGWGALAMQGLYTTSLTGLRWQHGWQYAVVMVLLSAASLAFARTVQAPVTGAGPSGPIRFTRFVVPLAIAQGLMAAGGLLVLATSGKLASMRADWAANRVFAGLAVAVLAVSLGTLAAHRRLPRGIDATSK